MLCVCESFRGEEDNERFNPVHDNRTLFCPNTQHTRRVGSSERQEQGPGSGGVEKAAY